MKFDKIEIEGILHSIQLKDINVTEIHSYIEKDFENYKEKYLGLTTRSAGLPVFETVDGHLVTNVIMNLTINDKDKDGKQLALISVKHKITFDVYELDIDDDATVKKIVGIIKYLIFPYFRGHVNQIAVMMGLNIGMIPILDTFKSIKRDVENALEKEGE